MKLFKTIKSLTCGFILPLFTYLSFSKDNMYVYTYMCMYICMYICIYMYVLWGLIFWASSVKLLFILK